jgi:cytidyltransferase-like protein
MKQIIVSGAFDDLRARHVRFLEEAAKFGELHALLWPDDEVQAQTGQPPKFPLAERKYVLEAVRYVKQVVVSTTSHEDGALPNIEGIRPDLWVADEAGDTPLQRATARAALPYRLIPAAVTDRLPPTSTVIQAPSAGRKKVVVTGCYDWFHSGHVRFCEECSQLGDLYVVVGHDANIRLLKGEGHPLFPQDERRYIVSCIRYVKQALISSGDGWMDAAPEIARLKPDIYAVNEDGDKPEKAAFCREHGLRYEVLKRTPASGLPRRTSTDLRGF